MAKNLSIKEGCLFVFLSRWDLPMITPFPMLLGLLKGHPWIQVHQGGYIMFKPTRQEILNIGQFIVIEYFIKSKVKHLGKLGCTFVIVGKSQWIGFDENDF